LDARLERFAQGDLVAFAYTRPYYKPDDARTAWKHTVKFLKRELHG
jgi:hypothetical protein